MIGPSTLLLVLLAVVVNASVLPKTQVTDDVCPVDSVPVADFQPDQFFDGQTWYMVAGAPLNGVTCVSVVTTYDADTKSVAFTQTITADGQVNNVTGSLTQDASSNAIYNYATAQTTMVETLLDTDYKTYGVIALCQHGTYEGQSVVILSRTAGTPVNYDALLKKLGDAGYAVDKITTIDTSGCSM